MKRTLEILALLASTIILPGLISTVLPAPARSGEGKVDAARVRAEAASGDDWLVNGRDWGEAHFSPLRQITEQNVGTLGLAWFLDIDSAMGMAAEPIEVDGGRCG